MHRVRALSGALAVVAAIVAGSHLAVADADPSANPVKGWCNGVFRPGPGTGIVQDVAGAPAEGRDPAGTATLTYGFRLTLTTPWHLPAGKRVHVASCAVVVPPDTSATTLSGRRSSFSSAFDEPGPITGADITLTVPASDRICDEAKMNGSGGDFRSNIVCVGPAPTAPARNDPAVSDPPCNGVFDPGPGTRIVQEVVGAPSRSRDPAGAAMLTYRFRLTPTTPWHPAPGTLVHVASCAVVVPFHTDPSTLSGRTASYSSVRDDPGQVAAADITLTVPASDRICDEARIDGDGQDLRSNIVCVGPAPTTPAGTARGVRGAGESEAAQARLDAAERQRPSRSASSVGAVAPAAPSASAGGGDPNSVSGHTAAPGGMGAASAVPGVPNSGADTPMAAGTTLVIAGIGTMVVGRRRRRP